MSKTSFDCAHRGRPCAAFHLRGQGRVGGGLVHTRCSRVNNPRNEGPNRRQCPLRIRRLLAGILPDAAEGKGCFRSQRLDPQWTEPTTGAVHYLTWTEQVFTNKVHAVLLSPHSRFVQTFGFGLVLLDCCPFTHVALQKPDRKICACHRIITAVKIDGITHADVPEIRRRLDIITLRGSSQRKRNKNRTELTSGIWFQ